MLAPGRPSQSPSWLRTRAREVRRVNDPNDWSREVQDPRYIVDLLARIVTVSLETMQIVDDLPPLAICADQNPTAG